MLPAYSTKRSRSTPIWILASVDVRVAEVLQPRCRVFNLGSAFQMATLLALVLCRIANDRRRHRRPFGRGANEVV